MLRLVPVTSWFSDLDVTFHKYPTLIYHREGNSFDADAIIRFLQEYQTSHLTIFGDTPQDLDNLLVAEAPTGAQLQKEQIAKYTIEEDNSFLHFWTLPTDAVVISEDNYEIGLMASLLASRLNAPLLFDGHFDYTLLDNQDIYVVGTISSASEIEIGMRGVKKMSYNLDDLRKEGLLEVLGIVELRMLCHVRRAQRRCRPRPKWNLIATRMKDAQRCAGVVVHGDQLVDDRREEGEGRFAAHIDDVVGPPLRRPIPGGLVRIDQAVGLGIRLTPGRHEPCVPNLHGLHRRARMRRDVHGRNDLDVTRRRVSLSRYRCRARSGTGHCPRRGERARR